MFPGGIRCTRRGCPFTSRGRRPGRVDDSATQTVTLDHTENDPRFQTEQPCQAFGGTVIILPGGEKICKDIDAAGTFRIANSKDVFPCKGLYKHMAACNQQYSRK